MKNKKAQLLEELIYIIPSMVFFIMLFYLVGNYSEGKPVYEQAYAKQIALTIDKAEPGTFISLYLGELVDKSGGKKAYEIVKIDNNEKKVFVSLGKYAGYSYNYFNDVKIEVKNKDELSSNKAKYFLEMEIKQK